LFAIVLSNMTETGNRRRLIADTRIQIAQHVERGEILRLTLDDLAVFFDGSRNLTHFEIFLGRTQSLCLVERHVYESRTGNNLGRGQMLNAFEEYRAQHAESRLGA